MRTSCPKIVYQYMRADHGLSLIKDPCLKITPPNQFNDAYELTARAGEKSSRRLREMLLQDKGARTTAVYFFNRVFKADLNQNDLLDVAKRQKRLWSGFLQHYIWAMTTAFALDFPRIASISHGIACFTEDPLSRLMWTHYADRNRGVAIGFDSGNVFFRKVPLKRVLYGGRRVLFPELFPKRSHEQLYQRQIEKLFRTKDLAYQYELEWRIILLLANCRKRHNGLFFRRIPRSCIKEVIIGPRCDGPTKLAIVRSVERVAPQVVVKSLTLHASSFYFVKDPLE